MRLLHFYPPAAVGQGGAAHAVRAWASAQSEHGETVSVACGDARPAYPQLPVRWEPTGWRKPQTLGIPTRLQELISTADVVLLHSGWTHYNIWAARMARRAGVPYVVAPHGAYNPSVFMRRRLRKKAWWVAYERKYLLRSCAVHIFFEEEREYLERRGFTGRTIVAPNGIEAPPLPKPERREDYLLWLGRFDPDAKGLDLLLHSLAAFPEEKRPEVRLHGPEGEGKTRLKTLVSTLGLEGSIRVGPAISGDAKWMVLRQARGFLFPARWDAHSMAVMEAAVCGVPLLVSTSTPIGRYLSTKGLAIGVPPTVAGIAEGLVQLLESSDASLGERARVHVEEHFGWPHVVRDYLRQLKEIL